MGRLAACRDIQNNMFDEPTYVYVPLFGKGREELRPVDARMITQGIYELKGEEAEGEIWQFAPYSQVRCISRTMPGNLPGMIAVELVRGHEIGQVFAEATLTPADPMPKPSPAGTYGFIVSFGRESFSSQVLPSGSGFLRPGVPEEIELKFLTLEAAGPYLHPGAEFSFFENGRFGIGRILKVL
jgi:hypothetical protein